MPSAQHNRMSGMTPIALCELTPDAPWSAAKKGPCTVTKGIMDHLREHYGTEYAPNTRETFRRQVLHQFVQGRIADYTPSIPAFPPTARMLTMRSRTRLWMSFDATEQRVGTRPWRNSVAKRVPWWSATSANGITTWFRSSYPMGRSFSSRQESTTKCKRPSSRSLLPGSLQARTCFTLETRPGRTCSLTTPVSRNSASPLPTTTSCRMLYFTTPSGTGCFSLRP